ncbi:MAG TPA: hypothetical protein VGQ22_01735 [Steroidobacteraceae bacterium]|nr:hypothetical protein [Steroidobacteraceae bacterium]
MTFDASSHRRLAIESDNWPLTWSDDDNQYAVWGDGGGFGSDGLEGRVEFGVARVTGDHDNYEGFNRFGGKDAECPGGIRGKGHGAPLSIGGVLYVWFTPSASTMGFDTFILFRSRDKGCTRTLLDAAFTREQDGVAFGSFVQFGKDYGLARDAYVYTVAVAVTDELRLNIVQRPGKIMLLRVPKLTIEDRGAYEFFAGQDSTGQPKWSTNQADKVPIYEDPLGVGPFPQMSFVPGLERLVYTNQHGDGFSTSTGISGFRSLLTLAEGPQPWGPWTVFYKDVFVPQIDQSVFQWNFAPKWFRNGGREFTLTFSGVRVNDSWNSIDGTFTVEQ